MTIKKGTLGRLNLIIPWKNLSGQSTIVKVEDLCLLIVPKSNEFDTNWENRLQITKQKKLQLNEMFKSGEGKEKILNIHINSKFASFFQKINSKPKIAIKKRKRAGLKHLQVELLKK